LSRNSDRLGSKGSDSSPPPNLTQGDNGGFSFVVPTEFVELPSQGKYYPEGHPLHNKESVEVRQMTAKEEDILTSRTLLKKGIALDRLLTNIIVDKSIDPQALLVGDRNAIIISTRVSGYGSEYSTKVSCPSCGTAQPYVFDLNEAEIYTADDLDLEDVVDNGDGTFSTLLPKTQLNVRFRLLTGIDERRMLKLVDRTQRKKRGTSEADHLITTQLKNIIVEVNDHTDREAITYVVENIPSIDARHLRLLYKRATPNVDLTQVFECNSCDHEQDMEVPLNADFFWPDR
jgi:hypothetical protein